MRHDDGKPGANHGKPSSSDRLRSPATPASCDCLRPPVGRLPATALLLLLVVGGLAQFRLAGWPKKKPRKAKKPEN